MRRPKMRAAEAARVKDEWLTAVQALSAQVRDWAEQQGWAVVQSEHEISEEELGTYTVPVLEIDPPQGQVMLEPIARFVMGAEGRVDLYAWPSHYRVMLLRKGEPQWVVRTDSGINWPEPWKRGTFVALAEALAAVA